ncbi:HAD family hydrolase [Silvibacterium sp.]|uniref:HAD family hydrolase n=1 Tax=Silvibacterium sp. TaxID=1964179 RepID=UPI0039E4A164
MAILTTVPTSPARYQTEEFEQAVLSLSPAIAVFDCDGTLWSGDAGYGFMIWSIETGLVSRNAADWIDSRYRQYRAGEVSEAEMCGEMVQIYAGLHEEELRHAAEVYFKQHIEAHIFEEMRDLLAQLKKDGVELWAVSSTNHWVIEEGVKRFGIPASRVLAAKVRVDGDIITSHLLAVPTDETKASGLVEAGVPAPDAVFGNSVHDAAMLAIARKAFPVNPTPVLSSISAERGWTVFYPEAVLADQKL